SNIDLFATSLAIQLCDVSDGPCQYDGPPMDRAHQTMGITDAHFNRVVEYLDAAMVATRIGYRWNGRFLIAAIPLLALWFGWSPF
ncbi:hypothetical protein SB776_36460, partial [Burkholderia sp. SIMBA_045]